MSHFWVTITVQSTSGTKRYFLPIWRNWCKRFYLQETTRKAKSCTANWISMECGFPVMDTSQQTVRCRSQHGRRGSAGESINFRWWIRQTVNGYFCKWISRFDTDAVLVIDLLYQMKKPINRKFFFIKPLIRRMPKTVSSRRIKSDSCFAGKPSCRKRMTTAGLPTLCHSNGTPTRQCGRLKNTKRRNPARSNLKSDKKTRWHE